MSKTLADFHAACIAEVEDCYTRGGSLDGVTVLMAECADGERIAISLGFHPDEKVKLEQLKAIKLVLIARNTVRYAFLGEAWTVTRKTPEEVEALIGTVRDQPDRSERVQVHAVECGPAGLPVTRSWVAVIKRDFEGKPHLIDAELLGPEVRMEGRMLRLLPPPDLLAGKTRKQLDFLRDTAAAIVVGLLPVLGIAVTTMDPPSGGLRR